jgi:hypothetical protein
MSGFRFGFVELTRNTICNVRSCTVIKFGWSGRIANCIPESELNIANQQWAIAN